MGLYTYINFHEIKLSRQVAEEARKLDDLKDQIDNHGYCEMKYDHVEKIVKALEARDDLAKNTKRKLNSLKFWLVQSGDYHTLMFT